MEESILKTIRKLIGGIDPGDEPGPFDMDLIVHINSVLQTLNQLGVGKEDFEITGTSESWAEFLGTKFRNLNWVKSYVYFKTKLMFDPPSSGTLYEAMKANADELEWRLNTKVDRAFRDPVKILSPMSLADAIVITRGDTYIAKISVSDSDDETYTPSMNDTITFTVKRTYDDDEALILKTIPSDTLVLYLEPNDTKPLDFGTYVYDIQIEFADGRVDTIIPRQLFVVAEEVG